MLTSRGAISQQSIIWCRGGQSPRYKESERAGDFLDLIGLENVAFLEVVESGQLDAALQAFADFAGVVLLALQRFDARSRR